MVSDELSFSPWCAARSKVLGKLVAYEIPQQPSTGYVMDPEFLHEFFHRVRIMASESLGFILSEAPSDICPARYSKSY